MRTWFSYFTIHFLSFCLSSFLSLSLFPQSKKEFFISCWPSLPAIEVRLILNAFMNYEKKNHPLFSFIRLFLLSFSLSFSSQFFPSSLCSSLNSWLTQFLSSIYVHVNFSSLTSFSNTHLYIFDPWSKSLHEQLIHTFRKNVFSFTFWSQLFVRKILTAMQKNKWRKNPLQFVIEMFINEQIIFHVYFFLIPSPSPSLFLFSFFFSLSLSITLFFLSSLCSL